MDVQAVDLESLDLEVSDHRSPDHKPANGQGADGTGANRRGADRGRAKASRSKLHRGPLPPAGAESGTGPRERSAVAHDMLLLWPARTWASSWLPELASPLRRWLARMPTAGQSTEPPGILELRSAPMLDTAYRADSY
jgi:hypothetical protein